MVTLATPTRPEELEELLLDRTKLATLQPGEIAAKVADYVAEHKKRNEELDARIKAEAQAVLAEMLQDSKKAKQLNFNPVDQSPVKRYAALANPRAAGAGLNGKFADLAEFTATVWHAQNNKDLLAKREMLNVYQEKVPSDGGFLVPEEFRAELLRLSLETAVVRSRARVVPMGSSTLRFPAVDATSHASSVFGGIVVYRTEEGASLTASQAKFASIKLEATKQTAYAEVTNELVRDAAGGFAMYIEQMFPEAIAFYEDLDFLTGTGVGEPLGALTANNPAIVSVAKETNQDADTIVYENIVKMYARMLPSSLNRAVWVVGPDAFPQLATMGLIVGTGGGPAWLPNLTGAPTMTLLGRPVVVSEKAPGLVGDLGDISFVDFGYYLIGDRQQMEMVSSAEYKFGEDKTAYRVIQRNDGRPWLQSAVTPANGGPTLSPFVQLAARA